MSLELEKKHRGWGKWATWEATTGQAQRERRARVTSGEGSRVGLGGSTRWREREDFRKGSPLRACARVSKQQVRTGRETSRSGRQNIHWISQCYEKKTVNLMQAITSLGLKPNLVKLVKASFWSILVFVCQFLSI